MSTNKFSRTVKIESPCRIDLMSIGSFNSFICSIVELTSTRNVSIESPTNKDTGIFRIVFIDKFKMDNPNFKAHEMQYLRF